MTRGSTRSPVWPDGNWRDDPTAAAQARSPAKTFRLQIRGCAGTIVGDDNFAAALSGQLTR